MCPNNFKLLLISIPRYFVVEFILNLLLQDHVFRSVQLTECFMVMFGKSLLDKKWGNINVFLCLKISYFQIATCKLI